MYTVAQIREFGNEIGPEANYMEILLFAHFSRRQSKNCNQYIYTSDKNIKFSIIALVHYLSQHVFCPFS